MKLPLLVVQKKGDGPSFDQNGVKVNSKSAIPEHATKRPFEWDNGMGAINGESGKEKISPPPFGLLQEN